MLLHVLESVLDVPEPQHLLDLDAATEQAEETMPVDMVEDGSLRLERTLRLMTS